MQILNKLIAVECEFEDAVEDFHFENDTLRFPFKPHQLFRHENANGTRYIFESVYKYKDYFFRFLDNSYWLCPDEIYYLFLVF